MNDIIAELRHFRRQDNLFTFWEQERLLRQSLRECRLIPDHIGLENADEIEFIFRALYFAERKTDFFRILFQSLPMMPVLSWLAQAPEWLVQDFLAFIPWHIINNGASQQQLQHLINIYQDRYWQAFGPIINALDLESCNFLLPRTASLDLRQMIRARQQYLQQQRKSISYHLDHDGGKDLHLFTIYGDKPALLRQAVNTLEKCSASNFKDPFEIRRIRLLLQAGERLFQAGLVEDALALFLDTYESYRDKNREADITEDVTVYKQFSKILRAVIPAYTLLYLNGEPYQSARNIYSDHFSQISPDESSLYYLELNSAIHRGGQDNPSSLLFELLYRSDRIKANRPVETVLLQLPEISQGLSRERIKELQALYRQKLASLPHEAFTGMEMLRLLNSLGLAPLQPDQAGDLLDAYIACWNWSPSPIFLNPELVNQLGPLTNARTRRKADQILDQLDKLAGDKLLGELENRPGLFSKKSEDIRRAILAGAWAGSLH